MTLSPNAKKVLKHMREHRTISNSEALDLYRLLDLPGLILELRADGHQIRTVTMRNNHSASSPIIYVLENSNGPKAT